MDLQPAEVVEVFAIKQQRVLRATPDLYDAFLTFDSGSTLRVKAEWTRHIEALVKFELSFTGTKGEIVYRKLPGFRSQTGIRVDVEGRFDARLASHLKRLAKQGIHGRQIYEPDGRSPKALDFTDEDNLKEGAALRYYLATLIGGRKRVDLDGSGPLPNLTNALLQVDVVTAIVRSADYSRPVTVNSHRVSDSEGTDEGPDGQPSGPFSFLYARGYDMARPTFVIAAPISRMWSSSMCSWIPSTTTVDRPLTASGTSSGP